MSVNTTPTKANLMHLKKRLAFSLKGYELLDKKRTVLIREIVKLSAQAETIEGQIKTTFAEAYAALQQANTTMGVNHVEAFALSVPEETAYDLRVRSVMGVTIPEVVLPEHEERVMGSLLGFSANNPALDVAMAKFNKVKNLSYALAEVEGKVYRLSREIRKTQKSANALDKLRIPELREQIKMIDDSITEKDREENFRIKKVKQHHRN